MTRMRTTAISLSAAAMMIGALATPVQAKTLSATLFNIDGAEVGTVELVTGVNGIVLRATVNGLSPGPHGFHVHTVGACSPSFADAGGHLNPEGRQHGWQNEAGAHAGDLPNISVAEDGTGTFELFLAGLTEEQMIDADGSAVVIHSGPDDYLTDPAGNSGDRIACGVVEPVGE